MGELSLDLRRRIVAAYQSRKTRTYVETAEMFGVGSATVGRLLRRQRETGDVKAKPRGGNNPRRVDLDWLREHARRYPDARLIDRVEAWEEHDGRRVSITAMSDAMRVIGWTHKEKRRLRASVIGPTWSRSVGRS